MMNTAMTRTRVTEQATADTNVSKGALATLGIASGLVGLWAVACFVSAMMTSGGPIALARAWVSAITGV